MTALEETARKLIKELDDAGVTALYAGQAVAHCPGCFPYHCHRCYEQAVRFPGGPGLPGHAVGSYIYLLREELDRRAEARKTPAAP